MIEPRNSGEVLRRSRHLRCGEARERNPEATSIRDGQGLTLTAIRAQTDIVQAMLQVFDCPTRYTLKSMYVIPATKDRLESFVQL